ncbi:retrovirus-related Pol polyprotein from transposon 17.6 [Trichonephila clavipes]|nr:retrovirus-related Pol polyprotein from transposon 17.6 [Trichonephila clavipes]
MECSVSQSDIYGTIQSSVGDLCLSECVIDNGQKIIIVAVYITPKKKLDDIIEFLHRSLLPYTSRGSALLNKNYDKIPMILSGDFNVNFALDKSLQLIEFLKDNFTLSLQNRIILTTKSNTIIDAVLLRYLSDIECKTYISYLSFHKPLITKEKTIQLAPSTRKPKPLQEKNNSTRQHERNNSTQQEKQLNSAEGMKQLDSAPPASPLQQNRLFLSTIVKEGLRTKEIFFGKVKITALIDSGSTVSLLRENTSRRIMDPTKLSKNKMLLTGIGEAQVTTIGPFEHEFEIDENYSLTWHVVPADKLKFVIASDLLEQASISFTKEGVKFNKYENHAQLMQISAENLQEELDLHHVENRQKSRRNLKSVNSRLQARKNSIYRRHNENYSTRRRTSLSTPSSTSFHRKTRSKQTDRRMAQRRHYTSEFFGICKSNRNGQVHEFSNATYQVYFRDLTRKGIVIRYLDGLVIPAKNEQEVLEKLKIIFEVAKKYGLEIKFKKCQFLKKKIEFLGHIVESGTIKPSPTKTLAVRKFPEPTTTIKQVQSFLGLTGYFRKYIKDYSKITKPLSDLTRKENLFVFFFGTQQKEAFEKLKKIMSEGPILHLYKYGRKTELHTDACKQGYGAILLEEAEDGKLHPVYYMSKNTNTAEEKYDSYELEVLAIINALKKLRVYLLGKHFKIVTECSAFQKIMQKKDLIPRIARWALQLEKFDYEIEHRAGSPNKKTGKKEGFLNPISKESIHLSTYHVDFIGPLPSTNKNYQHIFTVVDAFTKFTWLYPVKTVSAESALEKLKQQQKTFGNPIRIISDRGSAFTSKLFYDYCDEENIQHLQIATGVPRGNGQVEQFIEL